MNITTETLEAAGCKIEWNFAYDTTNLVCVAIRRGGFKSPWTLFKNYKGEYPHARFRVKAISQRGNE